MLNYARKGAHQVASAAAYKHQFFSESLFVRMQVLHMAGVWKGQPYRYPNTSEARASERVDRFSETDVFTPVASHV
jgi:spheroidene monooxygenase